MTALYVLLGIVLVLWLIGRVRLRGVAEYSAEGFLVQFRVLWFRINLYPDLFAGEKPEKPHKKEKKPKAEKPPKEKRETPLPEKLGGYWRLFQGGLPLVLQAVGTLKRKLRVDELLLHLTWAASDPADAAMGFGAGQAALGALWPLLEKNFDIRARDVGVAVDFQRTEPIVYARASLSLTVGQVVTFAVVYGVRALKLLLSSRRGNHT